MKEQVKYIVGIDEVGRGPVAGPVSVGAFCIKRGSNFLDENLKNSKALSEKKRIDLFKKFRDGTKNGLCNFVVSSVSNRVIDEKGISASIKIAVVRCLKKLDLDPKVTLVLLDGGLYAPKEFIFQKTIIKGDEKESVIAGASIVAKVIRDEYMKKISEKFPDYFLEKHKGYGSKAHMEAIKKHGPSDIHRKTFLRSIIDK